MRKKKPRDLGAELSEQRERLGITQREMAERYQIDIRTYQRWEAGHGVRAMHVELARGWTAPKKIPRA